MRSAGWRVGLGVYKKARAWGVWVALGGLLNGSRDQVLRV